MFGDVRVLVAERLWVASWDSILLDAQVVVPAVGGPVIKTAFISHEDTKVLPTTSVGLGYGSVFLFASGIPKVNFSNPAAPDGKVSRSEYELTLGYALSPNLTAALIYKGGRTSETTTVAATQLLGGRGKSKLWGTGIGLSGNAPISASFLGSGEGTGVSRLGVYGNFAYLEGRANFDLPVAGESSFRLNYQIAEVGLSYRLNSAPMGPISALTAQLGYRSQIIRQRNVLLPTFSANGVLVSTDRTSVQSTTHGLVLGLVASF